MESEKTTYRAEKTELLNKFEEEKEPTTAPKKTAWQKVVIGGVAGVLFGGASVYAADLLSGGEAELETETDSEIEGDAAVDNSADSSSYAAISEDSHFMVDDMVQVAEVDDNMSFGEAFAEAREQVGAGGVFEWHGGIYGTYYADEWDGMSASEKDEFGDHIAYASTNDVDIADSTLVAEGDPYENFDAISATADQEDGEYYAEEGTEDEYYAEEETEDEYYVEEETETYAEQEEPVEVVDVEDEVEILGVNYETLEDGSVVTIGQAEISGQEVFVVDVEQDGIFDIAFSDANNDGTIDDSEYTNIEDEGLRVSDFEAHLATADDDYLASAGPDYTTDDSNLA